MASISSGNGGGSGGQEQQIIGQLEKSKDGAGTQLFNEHFNQSLKLNYELAFLVMGIRALRQKEEEERPGWPCLHTGFASWGRLAGQQTPLSGTDTGNYIRVSTSCIRWLWRSAWPCQLCLDLLKPIALPFQASLENLLQLCCYWKHFLPRRSPAEKKISSVPCHVS